MRLSARTTLGLGLVALAVVIAGCGDSSEERADAWWERVQRAAMPHDEYEATLLEIKSVPGHIEQLKRLASEIEEKYAATLDAAIGACASGESDIGYVEASAVLDERFPMPFHRAVMTASYMRGRAAADFLTGYLFNRHSEVVWPPALHGVDGLLTNPDWSVDVAPSFETIVEGDWPLHGKVAVVYLLCQKGAYEVERVCSWLDTTGEEAALDPRPDLLEHWTAELRRLCNMP